jgi:hypothetical protein
LKEFIDKTAEKSGTRINRRNLFAIQGFIGSTTIFMADGSVVETNADGETLTTRFNGDGTITEVFSGEKTITKTTTFNSNGSITEALS